MYRICIIGLCLLSAVSGDLTNYAQDGEGNAGDTACNGAGVYAGGDHRDNLGVAIYDYEVLNNADFWLGHCRLASDGFTVGGGCPVCVLAPFGSRPAPTCTFALSDALYLKTPDVYGGTTGRDEQECAQMCDEMDGGVNEECYAFNFRPAEGECYFIVNSGHGICASYKKSSAEWYYENVDRITKYFYATPSTENDVNLLNGLELAFPEVGVRTISIPDGAKVFQVKITGDGSGHDYNTDWRTVYFKGTDHTTDSSHQLMWPHVDVSAANVGWNFDGLTSAEEALFALEVIPEASGHSVGFHITIAGEHVHTYLLDVNDASVYDYELVNWPPIMMNGAALTAAPTVAPTKAPTGAPTTSPTVAPTTSPTVAPTTSPTKAPTTSPTKAPTTSPTKAPTDAPSTAPTDAPVSSKYFYNFTTTAAEDEAALWKGSLVVGSIVFAALGVTFCNNVAFGEKQDEEVDQNV